MDIVNAATSDQEKYDASLKAVFAQPRIVAAILRMAVTEYEGMSVDEVLPYILDISKETPVDDISQAAMQKLEQERSSLAGKIIRYDLFIKAKNPKAGEINVNLYLDFEFQNKYYPGYSLIKRAMFYVARALDGQLTVIDKDTDYNSLQKAYSIWICNEDVPKVNQNTMTRYRIIQENVIGEAEDNPEEYDLMEVVMIRRGKEEIQEEVFDFLDGIFHSKLEQITKYTGEDSEIEKEVTNMGGFGAALAEKKLNEGRREGRQEASLLMSYLWKNGRGEEAERAAEDKDFFDQLLAELRPVLTK